MCPELYLAGSGGKAEFGGRLAHVLMVDGSRNSYICDVLQLLTGDVAAGFWCGNRKGSFCLWERD